MAFLRQPILLNHRTRYPNRNYVSTRRVFCSHGASAGKLPRLVASGEITDIHLFADASAHAYAAVIYGRSLVGGNFVSEILFAKSRLVPVKGLSIPRSELLGTLIGARALKFVVKNLHYENVPTYCWTDSKCVILWLKNEKIENYPRFVKNRIR